MVSLGDLFGYNFFLEWFFGVIKMSLTFTDDELKELKERLIYEFTEYQSNPNLAQYKELLGEFLVVLQQDDIFPTTENCDGVSIYYEINEFDTLDIDYSHLKSPENYKKENGNYTKSESIMFNANAIQVINSFFMIIYVNYYKMWIDNIGDIGFYNYFMEKTEKLLKHKSLLLKEYQKKILDYPYFVFKKYYSDQISFNKSIKETKDFLEEIHVYRDFINKCLVDISEYKEEIKNIEGRLSEQRKEFNFVKLSSAFRNMKKSKADELGIEIQYNRRLMGGIGGLLVVKLLYAIFGDFGAFDAKFAFVSISSIFLIAVLIYFFRISLMNIKSIKSQILQLDLRLSLCEFIHNYAEDSNKMRDDKMKDSLERFESIIFSPIVANDEQIPATFDNFDQFIKMMNIVNGGSGGKGGGTGQQ